MLDKKKLKSRKSVIKRSESEQQQEILRLQELCVRRYKESYKKYNQFFLKCVEEIEALQPTGYACIQASRFFVCGVLPKYCKIRDPLTKKQRERVERLLAE